MLSIRDLVAAPSRKVAPVLNGISLDVNRGEKVAILGPSGAGKTTLFRTITGFVPIKSGAITVDGVSLQGLRGQKLREWRCRIAMVSQRHDLVDRLKAYQNVMAGALGRWSTLHALRFLIQERKPVTHSEHQPVTALPENCRTNGLVHSYCPITASCGVIAVHLVAHDVHPHQGSGTVIPNRALGYPRMRIKHKFNVYVATHRTR